MFSPPNEPPHEMIDSTPLLNEQVGFSVSCKCKCNFSCRYLFHRIDFEQISFSRIMRFIMGLVCTVLMDFKLMEKDVSY